MNNIRKKNIINNFITQQELPYSDSADVTLKANLIVFAALNYSLQKLLDNDLFTERKLLLDSNYIIGPKVKNDSTIRNEVDNFTYFDGIDNNVNNLSIIQKIPENIEDTVITTLDLNISFLLNNNVYFAGTISGLYQSTNLSNWNKTTLSDLNNANIKSYYSNNNCILFPTDKGIYMLSGLELLLQPSLSNIICKNIYPKSTNAAYLSGNELMIGTTDGFFFSTFDNGNVGKMHHDTTMNGNINVIETISGVNEHDVLVGSNHGLYGSYRKLSYEDLNCVSAATNTYTYFYKQSASTKDKNYIICSTTGVYNYNLDTNVFTEIMYNNTSMTTATKVVFHNGIKFVCGKGLFYIEEAEEVKTLELYDSIFSNEVVTDVYADNEITVVATKHKIYWKMLNKGTMSWHHFADFPEDYVKNIFKKDGKIYCSTENGVYLIELDDGIISYTSNELVKKTELDITTTYTDIDKSILIGATTGLYDKDFKLVDIYRVAGSVAPDCNITDYVNMIKYQYMYDKDTYIICTNNGAYILDKNANGQYVLDDYHLLQGIDVKDALYFDDRLIFIEKNGFWTLHININDSELKDFLKVIDINNYDFTSYPNTITRLAKKNSIYGLDGDIVNQFEIYLTTTDVAEKYMNQFTERNVNAFGKSYTPGAENYKFSLADNSVLIYQQYSDASGKLNWKFDTLNDGTILSKSFETLNALNKNIASFEFMPATIYLNCIVAAEKNSTELTAVDCADCNGEYGIKLSTINFNENIVGTLHFYNTQEYDEYVKSHYIANVVATTDALYVNKAIPKINAALSVEASNSLHILKFMCIPFAYRLTGESEYSRHNLYIALGADMTLWYYDSSNEHETDIGTMHKITNTFVNLTELNINDFSLTDESFLNPNNIEQTKTKNAKLLIATNNGLYYTTIDFSTDRRSRNFELVESTKDFNITSIAIEQDKVYMSYVDNTSLLNKICYCDLDVQKTTNITVVDYNFAKQISTIKYVHGYLYVLSENTLYKIDTNGHIDIGKIYIIDESSKEIAITDDILVINGNTLSTYNGIKFEELKYNNSHLTAFNIFLTYDLFEKLQIVCFTDDDNLYRYDTTVKIIDKLDSFLDLTESPNDYIVNYFIRNCDGNASLAEEKRSEMMFSSLSASFNFYYDINYDYDSYSKCEDANIYGINKVHNYCVTNIYSEDETNMSATVDTLYVATTHGLFKTIDCTSFLNVTVDDDIANRNIVDICLTTDKLFVLILKDDKYVLKTCKTEITTNSLIITTDIITSEIDLEDITSMSYMQLNDVDENYHLFFTTTNSVYYYDFQYKIRKVKDIETNVNCIYDTEQSLLIGKNDGLYYLRTDDVLINLTTKNKLAIKHIYDDTTDINIYVGGSTGVSAAVLEDYTLTKFNTIDDLLSSKAVESFYTYNQVHYSELDDHNIYASEKIERQKEDVINTYINLYSDKFVYNIIDYDQTTILVNKRLLPVLIDIINGTIIPFETNLTPLYEVQGFWHDNKCQYMKVEGKVYYRVGQLGNFIQIEDDDLNNVSDIHDFMLIDDKLGLYSFANISRIRYFLRLISSKKVYCIHKISNKNMLIGTDNGIYWYNNGNILKNKAIDSGNVYSIILVPKEDIEGKNIPNQYLLGVNSKLYISSAANNNFNSFEFLFDLAKYNVTKITGIYVKNSKEYVIATDIGILNTRNLYHLINTYNILTVAGIRKKVSEYFDIAITNHIDKEHTINNAVTKANNNIMPVDFSEIDKSWQITNEKELIIENDLVNDVEFLSDVKYITAQYKNFTTDYDHSLSSYSWKDLPELTYIVKNWKSFNKELYVYLPTTNTKYVSHVTGVPGCTNDFYKFKRQNSKTEILGNVNDTCTLIRLYLDNKHFDIDEIYNVEINGNSLPLEIYVENEKSDSGNSNKYYHSYILPSISEYAPLYNDINDDRTNLSGDYLYLDFKCFGTDAQAIKITAKAKTYYTIVFNSMDSNSGQMNNFKVQINSTVKLPKNVYVKDGYMFKGWSTTENGIVEYTDLQEIRNISYNIGSTVTLYAVWKYYVFDESLDTVIRLNSNTNMFAIAYGDTCKNNSNIIIDYNYVGDTTMTLQPNGELFYIHSGQLLPYQTTVVIDCEDETVEDTTIIENIIEVKKSGDENCIYKFGNIYGSTKTAFDEIVKNNLPVIMLNVNPYMSYGTAINPTKFIKSIYESQQFIDFCKTQKCIFLLNTVTSDRRISDYRTIKNIEIVDEKYHMNIEDGDTGSIGVYWKNTPEKTLFEKGVYKVSDSTKDKVHELYERYTSGDLTVIGLKMNIPVEYTIVDLQQVKEYSNSNEKSLKFVETPYSYLIDSKCYGITLESNDVWKIYKIEVHDGSSMTYNFFECDDVMYVIKQLKSSISSSFKNRSIFDLYSIKNQSGNLEHEAGYYFEYNYCNSADEYISQLGAIILKMGCNEYYS